MRYLQAAIYGSGCWAQNEKDDRPGVACSTTGTGEQIMRTMFTYKCVDRIMREDDIQTAVTDALKKDFLGKQDFVMKCFSYLGGNTSLSQYRVTIFGYV